MLADRRSEGRRGLREARSRLANPTASVYRGVEVSVDARGLATAIVDGFLLIGREAGVRAVIDVGPGPTGRRRSPTTQTASQVRDELPERPDRRRLCRGELGIAELFGDDGSARRRPAQLRRPGGLEGAAALAVVADDDGLELSTRSALDPEARQRSAPGSFAALPGASSRRCADGSRATRSPISASAIPARRCRALLQSAARQAPGIARRLHDSARRLGKAGDVDLAPSCSPALGDEAAFALIPRVERPGASGDALPGEPTRRRPCRPTPARCPYIELLADVSDEDAAREALAELQPAARQDASASEAAVHRRAARRSRAAALRVSPTAAGRLRGLRLAVRLRDRSRRGSASIADPEPTALSSTELLPARDRRLRRRALPARLLRRLAASCAFAEASGPGARTRPTRPSPATCAG